MARKKSNLAKLADTAKKRAGERKLDRLAAFRPEGPTEGADWGACSPEWVHAVVQKITALSGAVTFGTSRDGTSYSLTLMLDDGREALWFDPGADLNEKLEAVCATLDAME